MSSTNFLLHGPGFSITNLEIADSPGRRMKGLLGRPGLPEGHGLYIPGCHCIHTWFMRFTLDLIFLDDSLRVVRVVEGVRPFNLVCGGLGTRSVVEVENGWLRPDQIKVGDVLKIEPVPGTTASP